MAYGLLGAVVNVGLAFLALTLVTFSASAAEPVKILAFGDSLTAGYGLPKADSFPAQLEKALKEKGHNVVVLNSGVSGDTSAGGLSRINWSLSEKPQVVILELGANDGLRGLDPTQTRANLKAIINVSKKAGAKVLLTGMMAPPNLGKQYGAEFNGLYKDLAKQNDVALYPFFLEGVAAKPELNLPDGIHPTGEGIAIIVKGILPYVEKLLE